MAHKKVQRIDPLSVKLPLGGADSHAHLDSPEFAGRLDEIIALAKNAGVSRIGNIFLSPAAYRKNHELLGKWPGIFYLLGIHPCDGLSCTPECLEEIEKIFSEDARVRAVGEIGLDYHWDDCPKEIQMQVFGQQLEMAKKIGKPVVIHCREAEEDCLTILESRGFSGYPLLWHCFGGDKTLAKRILHNGWHISIPGPVTYRANKNLREALAVIPQDRLLLETDCPYLSPVPWRGQTNQPAFIVFTARMAAEARGENPEELWKICGENTARFFGLEELSN